MIECLLTAIYTPSNTIVTPDPAASGGAWGDAVGDFAADTPPTGSGWELAVLGFDVSGYGVGADYFYEVGIGGPDNFLAMDIINVNSISGSLPITPTPAIRLIYRSPFNSGISNLETLQGIFEDACDTAAAKTALAAFDSGGVVTLTSTNVALSSNEEPI